DRHHPHAEPAHAVADRLRLVQQAKVAEYVDEVVRARVAGPAGEQDVLRLPGVVDVGRGVDQRDCRPPQHHRGREWIAVLDDQDAAEDQRQQHLEQRPAEVVHELAERPEDDVAEFVDRHDRVVHERAPDLPRWDVHGREIHAVHGDEREQRRADIDGGRIHLFRNGEEPLRDTEPALLLIRCLRNSHRRATDHGLEIFGEDQAALRADFHAGALATALRALGVHQCARLRIWKQSSSRNRKVSRNRTCSLPAGGVNGAAALTVSSARCASSGWPFERTTETPTRPPSLSMAISRITTDFSISSPGWQYAPGWCCRTSSATVRL